MVQRHIAAALLLTALASPAAVADLAARPEVKGFIDEMVTKHHFDRDQITTYLRAATIREDILTAIAKPAEAKPWRDYQPLFLTEDRIRGGVEFWNSHAETLAAAEREFGVEAHVIVAIIGVETRYGRHTGRYRVLDALSTLAFDYPPRSPFFRAQLMEFLIMAREEGVDAREPLGSYAGAMGLPQFMPSSFRNFAVDFDGDGRRDLWQNPVDVVGSVANYFHMHGWRAQAPVVHRIDKVDPAVLDPLVERGLLPSIPVSELTTLGITVPSATPTEKVAVIRLEGPNGMEYWVARHNFYVITRYNRSPLYAMAVRDLSEAVRAKRSVPQNKN